MVLPPGNSPSSDCHKRRHLSQRPRLEAQFSKKQIAKAAAYWEGVARRYGAAILHIHEYFNENETMTREQWAELTQAAPLPPAGPESEND
jgi:hypothetical protein